MLIREIERLQDKFHLFGYLPYLRKFDLQLFFKRFRYYVAKRFPKEKVRYFAIAAVWLCVSCTMSLSVSKHNTNSHQNTEQSQATTVDSTNVHLDYK